MKKRNDKMLPRLAGIFITIIMLLSFGLVPNAHAQQAQLQLQPLSGPPGTTITVTGTGFQANAEVLVGPGVYASEPASTQRVTTDGQGRFTVQVTIPVNADPDRRWVVAANPIAQSGFSILADFDVTTEQVAEPQTYVVRPGDYLSLIARRFNTTVPALVRANPEIENPNLIFVGQELVIPGSLTTIPDGDNQVYVVKQGDTLSEIALRFGVTTGELTDVNDIENPRRLSRGRRLMIPAPVDIIPETGRVVYTVQPGDTLSEIAVDFRTTVSELVSANPEIFDPNFIFSGQRLRIPEREELEI